MRVYYWIHTLRAPLVFRVLRARRSTNIKQVIYIKSTSLARLILKILNILSGWHIIFQHVEERRNPSGPRFNLSSVRNANGEVITFDLYHHVLNIRRQIVMQLVESFKDLCFFKSNQELMGMIAAYLGMKVAAEITSVVYMAHYAKWKTHNDERPDHQGDNPGQPAKNILIIPGSGWNHVLVSNLKELVDEIHVDKNARKNPNIVKHLLRAIRELGMFQAMKALRTPIPSIKTHTTYDQSVPVKLMVNYRMGLLEDERNDIAFFHSSTISPEQLLIFCKSQNYLPSPEEVAWLKSNGIECFTGPGIKNTNDNNGIRKWHPSSGLNDALKEFYQIYIKTAAEIKMIGKEKDQHWLLEELWTLGVQTAFWKDFFLANNVRILINAIPSDTNFIPNIAIAKTGGIAAELERSIRFDYCTYIHNSPNHIYFATGPYSLTQTPEPFFSEYVVQTGGINISRPHVPIEGMERMKEKSGIVIAVFDELSNDWFFGDSIAQLYQAMIDLLKMDQRFSLLIKTKKPKVLEKIEGEGINRDIEQLVKTDRFVFASWKITPAAAAFCADFVVCIPSTAAFESVMTGTPTVVYNPMRVGSSIFYRNNGLNQRIFEDSETMIAAIRKYADGIDDSIGDCSDILPFIDPFNDGKGAERMGQFVQWCLEGFAAGMKREPVIQKANEWYTEKWGKDKVTSIPQNDGR
ncbi:MAG: hypothetical protein JSV88_21580 [Candidatus Aminicenantes bacterium]|nr:MAG: hypothetical protein JSV88_21580 [Candidatus Aminicenantes bacterium]